MSVIKDLLNGITPKQRKLLDEQEKEKERKAIREFKKRREEDLEKMRSADITKKMANWVAERLSQQNYYWEGGYYIHILNDRIIIASVEQDSEGPCFLASRSFISYGYENLPGSLSEVFGIALTELAKAILGNDYTFEQKFFNSYETSFRYEASFLVKRTIVQKSEELKKW